MSGCREVQTALLAWDEATDLPEPLAVHLGGCPACRARFDQLFVPSCRPSEPQLAPLVGRRPHKLAPLAVLGVGLAAVALAALGLGVPPSTAASVDLAELVPPECVPEIVLPECPVG